MRSTLLRRRALAGAGLTGVAALLISACGGTATTTATTAAAPAAATATTSSAGGSAPAAGVTIASANVAGVGTVLVNGDGKTLYLLTSEQGGKLTCTDDNGCTKFWPDTELPSGVTAATAGTGVDASKLGSTTGSLYVTYAGWPLYTFIKDTAVGSANGEGINSFGGIWETLTPAGTPVIPSGTSSGAATTTTTKY
jgi:predicted lipoprotein with Yx(FWY)xxD motif